MHVCLSLPLRSVDPHKPHLYRRITQLSLQVHLQPNKETTFITVTLTHPAKKDHQLVTIPAAVAFKNYIGVSFLIMLKMDNLGKIT